MPRFLFSCQTGPTLVKDVAAKMRGAGLSVACEGTEHVHVESEGTDALRAGWNLLVDLQRTHGTDLGLRPKLIRALS